MKSIVFIFPSSQLGGAERIMFNLAKYLNSINYEVVLFILSNSRNPVIDISAKESSIKVIYCDSINDKNLFSYKKLFETIKRNNFDFIFTSHIITNALLSLFLKKSKINSKLISRESTVPFERFAGYKIIIIKLLYKFFYGKQNILIFQTDFMKKILFTNLGYSPAKNCIVIPNCVDIDNIKTQINTSDLHYNNDTLTFIACGRMVNLKQFDILVRSYYSFKKIYRNKTRLIILGDGPEFNNIKVLVDSLNLNHEIFMLGQVSNPVQYFAISDIGIICSKVEGFPNVILEMMTSGIKNILSTPCTPAVYELPNISISSGFSEEDIFELLCNSIENFNDNSLIYKNYILENRTVSNYWNIINSHLNLNEKNI